MNSSTVGNYRLLGPLGEGGMGVVYRAEHVTMGRRAAVKLLRAELARDEQAVLRFFNEARAANEINHPGIVQIYDCGTTADGAPWLVMELLEGETLAARLARVGKLSAAEAIDIAGQAASALGAAHQQGIVHRDLKPDNLFIVRDPALPRGERVKVLDFGIAKLGAASTQGMRVTRTGIVMGTPAYMSPEQCRGSKLVDARSDVYSLGLILFEMMAGAPPFVSQGMGELFYMHMSVTPPRLDEKAPEVGARLADVVGRTMEKEPAQRFQDMGDLARSLSAGAIDVQSGILAAPALVETPSGEPAAGEKSSPWRSVSGETRILQGTDLRGTNPESAKPKPEPRSTTTLSASSAEVLSPPRSVQPRHLVIGGVLALAGAAIAAMLVFGKPPPSPPPEVVEEERPVPAPPTGPSGVAPAPETGPGRAPAPKAGVVSAPAPAPEPTVAVEIATVPSEARVVDVRDGSLLGVTPLRKELRRGPGTIELRVEKRGHLSRTLEVPLDRGFKGSLRLGKAAGSAPPAEKIIKL
jgi:eukaryotic-like serine/threonine-protein kinase